MINITLCTISSILRILILNIIFGVIIELDNCIILEIIKILVFVSKIILFLQKVQRSLTTFTNYFLTKVVN